MILSGNTGNWVKSSAESSMMCSKIGRLSSRTVSLSPTRIFFNPPTNGVYRATDPDVTGYFATNATKDFVLESASVIVAGKLDGRLGRWVVAQPAVLEEGSPKGHPIFASCWLTSDQQSSSDAHARRINMIIA